MTSLLLALLACNGGDSEVELTGVTLTPSDDISTVATVSWSTDVETTGYVRFRTADDVFQTAVTAPGTDHQVVLVGVPPDTDVEWQIVVQEGGVDSFSGELQTWTTGSLPTGLPGMSVTGDGHSGFMVTPVLGSFTGPMVLDRHGHIVWHHADDRGLDVYRARIAPDGSGIIYNAASVSGEVESDTMLVKVSWDGSTVTEIPVQNLAHDFVELPDGSIGAIGVQYGEGDEAELLGNKLIEIAPDGTATDVWSAWDCFDPETQPGDTPALGWTWTNALDYDEVNDEYHLSIYNFSSIAIIPRSSFACEEVIGDEAATIELEGARYRHQHQFELDGDRLLVFDNDGAGGTESRVLEYQVDWQTGVATNTWEYRAEPPIYSFVLGDVHRYDDGDTLITWSVAGQLERVDSAGNQQWALNTDLGYGFGFLTVYESLYE